MDKSLEVNFYEDLFASMAKPHHLDAVKQCVSVFAKDVVAAYLQGGVGSRPASQTGDEQGVARIIEEVDNESSEAISIVNSPGSSSANSASHPHRNGGMGDDIDSDGLLHRCRRRGEKAQESKSVTSAQNNNGNNPVQWITAVGKEWLTVSKDPQGRQAMAAVVGTAAREVVAGVSTAMTERYSMQLFVVVLLMGVMSAVVMQQMLRMVGW